MYWLALLICFPSTLCSLHHLYTTLYLYDCVNKWNEMKYCLYITRTQFLTTDLGSCLKVIERKMNELPMSCLYATACCRGLQSIHREQTICNNNDKYGKAISYYAWYTALLTFHTYLFKQLYNLLLSRSIWPYRSPFENKSWFAGLFHLGKHALLRFIN